MIWRRADCQSATKQINNLSYADGKPEKSQMRTLVYRFRDGRLEVFLAHPGGPFFARKGDGHWTIPKGAGEEFRRMLAWGEPYFCRGSTP